MYKQIVKRFDLISISIFIGIVTSYVPAVFSEAYITHNLQSVMSILLILASIFCGFQALQYRKIIESKISEKIFINNNSKAKENPKIIEQTVFENHSHELKKVGLNILAMFICVTLLTGLQGALQKEKLSISDRENKNQYDIFTTKIDSILSSLSDLSFDVTKDNYHNSLQKQPQSYQNYLQIKPLFDNCNSLSNHYSSAFYNSCTEDSTK